MYALKRMTSTSSYIPTIKRADTRKELIEWLRETARRNNYKSRACKFLNGVDAVECESQCGSKSVYWIEESTCTK